jgi:hypothetical protein
MNIINTYIDHLEKLSANFSSSESVLMFENYLNSNTELQSLLLEYHSGNVYLYDETLTPKYVERDIKRFITFLKGMAERESDN